MRPFMQRRIDALHAEIDRLKQVEKDYVRRKSPGLNEFQLGFKDAGIDVDAWHPTQRKLARQDCATLRDSHG